MGSFLSDQTILQKTESIDQSVSKTSTSGFGRELFAGTMGNVREVKKSRTKDKPIKENTTDYKIEQPTESNLGIFDSVALQS